MIIRLIITIRIAIHLCRISLDAGQFERLALLLWVFLDLHHASGQQHAFVLLLVFGDDVGRDWDVVDLVLGHYLEFVAEPAQ